MNTFEAVKKVDRFSILGRFQIIEFLRDEKLERFRLLNLKVGYVGADISGPAVTAVLLMGDSVVKSPHDIFVLGVIRNEPETEENVRL